MADAPNHSALEYLAEVDAATLSAALGRLREGALFALLPEGAAAQVPVLQQACRASGRALCGGLFPRLIHDGRFVGGGAWLYVLAPGTRHGLVDSLAGTAAEAAQRVAEQARPALDAQPEAGLFLVVDATTPNVASIVDALYLELGHRSRLLGVNAGSETFQPMPCVFDGARVTRGLLWLTLDHPERTVLLHDYTPTSTGSLCTATTGNRIAAIDFRPAFDVYRERMRQLLGVELTRENFYRYAAEYPFAIQLANGQLLVRMPTSVEPDGSIHCVGEVPENAVLTIATAPPARAPATGRALRERLDERQVGSGLLLFYCAGRRMRLGDESEADLQALLSQTARPTGGATSLGEIGAQRSGGYPGFHNGAFVCLGW